MPTALAPSPAVAAPSLAALRQATRAAHAAAERRLDLARLADPGHYARVLQAFHAFHASWEAALAEALPPAWRDWAAAGSRRAWLAQDLQALGVAAPALPAPPLALPGEAAAIGSLYVLEGSALGGQVIVRRLGLDPVRGGAYFHGWGPATGTRWRAFCGRLEAALAGPRARAQACAGACRTFGALDRWLQENLG